MYKLWLSLALGAGLLACGTPDTARDPQKPKTEDPDDGDDSGDEDSTSSMKDAGKKDAGKPDAGKSDAGKSDAGGAGRTPDAGPITTMRDAGQALTPGVDPTIPDPTNGQPAQPGDNGGANNNGGGDTNNGGGNNNDPGATPGAGAGLGGGCGATSDCASGYTCFTTVSDPEVPNVSVTFPGGYCTKGCKADAECGAGAGCPFGPFTGFAPIVEKYSQCATRCEQDSECRSGYQCKVLRFAGMNLGAAKHCQPPNPFEESLPPGIL